MYFTSYQCITLNLEMLYRASLSACYPTRCHNIDSSNLILPDVETFICPILSHHMSNYSIVQSKALIRGRMADISFVSILHLPSVVLALTAYREKGSALYFPRRPGSRTLCTHDTVAPRSWAHNLRKISDRVNSPESELTSKPSAGFEVTM